jgi:hypothetical protein
MVPTSKRAMAFAVVSPLMPMASAFMGYTIPEFMGKSSSVVPEPLRAVKPAAHATTATTASPTTPFLPLIFMNLAFQVQLTNQSSMSSPYAPEGQTLVAWAKISEIGFAKARACVPASQGCAAREINEYGPSP